HKDYMELKSRLEASNSYFEKEAIRRYELWMQNAIRRVKRAREIELALHYQLLWAVREEMRQVNTV
ncbi:11419_t:CDS:2, partial [Entrophospora sp. SA101]